MRTLEPGRFAGTAPALVISTPTGHVQQIALAPGATLIAGRDPELPIAIPDESVSRRHAEFRAAPLGVRDLGSSNGTRVQGSPIGRGWTSLDAGSLVELGDSVVLVRGTSAPAVGEEGRGAARDDVLVPPRRLGRGSEPPPSAGLTAAAGGAPGWGAPAMRQLASLIELVAPSRLSVLILGETGAGKEVVARALHAASDRRDRRLLTLNCAALPATLLESELFGHEKGAFTGALAAKPGLFEAAAGGTIFLDEIGELPLETQAKLLRVLESGEVRRVGALAAATVDVRFLAATHKDLAGLAERGQFRLDLLFRIAGVTLEVPPLRDRRDDLAALARSFLVQGRRQAAGGSGSGSGDGGDDGDAFTPAALAALARHPWPGNVRELKATIERAALLARGGTIDAAHLTFGVGVALGAAGAGRGTTASPSATSPELASAAPASAHRDQVAARERERILAALEACAGNQSRAARALGISRATLVRRLEAYGVARPRK